MKEIFGGTVVGYVTESGQRLMAAPPPECNNDGYFSWRAEAGTPTCLAHEQVSEALFRVDVAIVGPAVGDLASYSMHRGDGDCDQDFRIGEKWLIAGPVIEELAAPIRPDEVVTLQRLAAHPAFDRSQLYR